MEAITSMLGKDLTHFFQSFPKYSCLIQERLEMQAGNAGCSFFFPDLHLDLHSCKVPMLSLLAQVLLFISASFIFFLQLGVHPVDVR